jgi:hypothetical protein
MTRMRSEGNSACEEPPSCQLKKRIVNLLLLVASGDNYCTLGCSKYLASVLQKSVLSFEPNRVIEVWPNSLAKPNIWLVTYDKDEI